MDRRALLGHSLVLLATIIGILGMGMVFQGVMDGSLREISRGVPPLLLGLWWAGRELGRSLLVSRARRPSTRPETAARSRSSQAEGS
jgi:hypothetical protein